MSMDDLIDHFQRLRICSSNEHQMVPSVTERHCETPEVKTRKTPSFQKYREIYAERISSDDSMMAHVVVELPSPPIRDCGSDTETLEVKTPKTSSRRKHRKDFKGKKSSDDTKVVHKPVILPSVTERNYERNIETPQPKTQEMPPEKYCTDSCNTKFSEGTVVAQKAASSTSERICDKDTSTPEVKTHKKSLRRKHRKGSKERKSSGNMMMVQKPVTLPSEAERNCERSTETSATKTQETYQKYRKDSAEKKLSKSLVVAHKTVSRTSGRICDKDTSTPEIKTQKTSRRKQSQVSNESKSSDDTMVVQKPVTLPSEAERNYERSTETAETKTEETSQKHRRDSAERKLSESIVVPHKAVSTTSGRICDKDTSTPEVKTQKKSGHKHRQGSKERKSSGDMMMVHKLVPLPSVKECNGEKITETPEAKTQEMSTQKYCTDSAERKFSDDTAAALTALSESKCDRRTRISKVEKHSSQDAISYSSSLSVCKCGRNRRASRVKLPKTPRDSMVRKSSSDGEYSRDSDVKTPSVIPSRDILAETSPGNTVVQKAIDGLPSFELTKANSEDHYSVSEGNHIQPVVQECQEELVDPQSEHLCSPEITYPQNRNYESRTLNKPTWKTPEFEALFRAYSKQIHGMKSVRMINKFRSGQWLESAGIFDNSLTKDKANAIFVATAGTKLFLDIDGYIDYLRKIARRQKHKEGVFIQWMSAVNHPTFKVKFKTENVIYHFAQTATPQTLQYSKPRHLRASVRRNVY